MRNIKFSAFHHDTILNKLPCSVKLVGICEAEAVLKNEIIVHNKVAMHMTDFDQLGGHVAERIYDTVVVERSAT